MTYFTFNEDKVQYYYAKYIVKSESNKETKDTYSYQDDFIYFDLYSKDEIHNKNELINTIYYIVNNHIENTKRYFSIDYLDYENDYKELFQNEEKLNIINNFVHPYNSFKTIEASLDGYILEINVKYDEYYTRENINLVNKEIDNIMKDLITEEMTDKDKIKEIHDYIINNTKYDEDFCIDETTCTNTSEYKADTAYGVLFNHYGICSGYTDLMAIFLNRLNIINYKVSNDTHTWNAVKIDNNWYHLDTTWDDPISEKDILSHNYFLITTDEDSKLEQAHTFNKEIFIELS